MPRKVTVAFKATDANGNDASLFPLPPDPTSNRKQPVDENNKPRESPGNEDPSTPSLRAGFLPPAPKEAVNNNINDNGNNNGDRWNSNDENRNQNVIHHDEPHYDAAYGQHNNDEAWHEWHQQPHWHHYAPPWWQHPYYDDPPPPNPPDGYPHPHAAYHEFLPPVDPVHDAKHKEPSHANTATPVHPHPQYHHYPPPNKRARINGKEQRGPPAPPTAPPGWPSLSHPKPSQHHYKAIEPIPPPTDRIPAYPYSDAFAHRSFDQMLQMLRQFQRQFPNERDFEHPIDNDESNSDSLTLSSWIKEIRWIRRARATDDEKSPKATRGRDKPPTFPSCPDCLSLTPERIRQLDSIPFPWQTDRTSWQKWLDDLLHFRSAKSPDDTANVPLKYSEYPSLGNFVNRQRTEYRKLLQGKNSSMTQTKMQDLNKVGFVWSVREGGHTSWDVRLMELREYRRVNGHCNVPKIYKANPSLGYWVSFVC
jgi:hypothetical protein